MNESLPPPEDSDDSSAGWIMTFADLMSLLMCFFVLLLSFSEMDVQKFKQIAGSMKMAFGVQRDLEFKMIPKGTSVVTQEFTPGKPTPTPLKEMRQHTTDETKDDLDFTDSLTKHEKDALAKELRKEAAEKLQKEVKQLSDVLDKEIDKGLVKVEARDPEIMIRIREKGSFPSGSANLQKSFLPILKKIGKSLQEVDGKIIVAGHTDDVPISTPQYPSNWLLSAARSAAVVHYLTKFGSVDSARIQIRAHADTLPVASNNSSENRAKNRRVDIIVQKDLRPIADQDLTTEIAKLAQ